MIRSDHRWARTPPFPFPARFDAPEKRWAFEEGQIGWDQVLKRWKARGPMNQAYVASLQRGWSATPA